MDELFLFGPPVYFVLTTKLSMSEIANQNLLCGGQGCNSDSIVTKLHMASTNSEMYVGKFEMTSHLLLYAL